MIFLGIWYCKFILPRPLKWGILGVCTIDFSKNLWKYFFMNSPEKRFFLQYCKNLLLQKFAFHYITVEPIKLQTCCAPQNNHLNLIFVKDFLWPVKKWLEMVVKWLFLSCYPFSWIRLYIYSNDCFSYDVTEYQFLL